MLLRKAKASKPKKRTAKGADDDDDDMDDVDVNDAVAPALQARFDAEGFQRCSKLSDAVVVYLVRLDAKKDEPSKKLVCKCTFLCCCG